MTTLTATKEKTLGMPRTEEILELYYRERYIHHAQANPTMNHTHVSMMAVMDTERQLTNPFYTGANPPKLNTLAHREFIDRIKAAYNPKVKPLGLKLRLMMEASSHQDKYLVWYVDVPNLSEPEIVINSPKNIANKLSFLDKIYDEDLVMNNNPNIKITSFKFIEGKELESII